jgi:hypothetical protein
MIKYELNKLELLKKEQNQISQMKYIQLVLLITKILLCQMVRDIKELIY